MTTRPGSKDAEERTEEGHVPAPEGLISEVSPLVLLQVNCRSICNKILEICNFIDTYNPDVVIGTESRIREEINKTEAFRENYKVFMRDRYSRGGGVFICVKSTSITGYHECVTILR